MSRKKLQNVRKVTGYVLDIREDSLHQWNCFFMKLTCLIVHFSLDIILLLGYIELTSQGNSNYSYERQME